MHIFICVSAEGFIAMKLFAARKTHVTLKFLIERNIHLTDNVLYTQCNNPDFISKQKYPSKLRNILNYI